MSDNVLAPRQLQCILTQLLSYLYVYRKAVKDLGLEGRITGEKASKKWENLKKRYKVILWIEICFMSSSPTSYILYTRAQRLENNLIAIIFTNIAI